jgi:cell division septal protein FtsQ
MYRYLFGRDGRPERVDRMTHRGWRRRRWPQSRAMGCLLWLVILIVLLILLSMLFGGFQKGTKVSGQAHFGNSAVVAVRL